MISEVIPGHEAIGAVDSYARLVAAVSLRRLSVRGGDPHQTMIDAGLAALVVLFGVASWPAMHLATFASVGYGVVVALCGAVVLWRVRAPLWSMSLLAVALLVHIAAVGEISVLAGVMCVVAAYTTQAELRAPWRWIFGGALLAGVAVALLVVGPTSVQPNVAVRLRVIGIAWLVLALFGLLGELRRRNRERLSLAVERVGLVEARQASDRQLAVIGERHRIAREMHDVLAHSLAVIAVQAEGARLVLDSNPDQVRRSLADIARLSRHASSEVGEVLNVLRANDAPQQEWSHQLRELPALLDSYLGAGLRMNFTQDGEADDVPAHVGATAYRIVQEALTNTLAHAGQVECWVSLTVKPGQLNIVVSNRQGEDRHPETTSGHGLNGLAERARALHGDFAAGPQPGGRWTVEATLPWQI